MPKEKQEQESNPLLELIRKIKIAYAIGKDPVTSAMASRGFTPSKNAALNYGKIIMNMPYDPEMRIRPKDPQQQLRAITSGIGRVERIHNAYIKPRVKLAD
jgi:hypothetical protein